MSSPKRLFRKSAAGRIAGVCAGIAEYLDTDVTLVRLAWVVLSIVPDASVPADVDTTVHRLTRSTVDRKIAGVCGGLAEYMHVDSTVVRLVWAILTVVPGAIVLGVFAFLVAWFIMPESRAPREATAPSAA